MEENASFPSQQDPGVQWGWGGWCAQSSPPKVTSPSKYPHPNGGGSLCTLGVIQLLLLPSSRSRFIFAVSLNPTCSRPASDFTEGRIGSIRPTPQW